MTTWESLDKLIKKKIIREGYFSEKPTELSRCNVLINKFQSIGMSVEQIRTDLHSEIIGKTLSQVVVIGQTFSRVDRYIERAIQTMSINEKSLITIQIPANNVTLEETALELELTLQSCEFYKPIWLWTLEKKYETALNFKEKGVELFKVKRVIDAFYSFSKACKILITVQPIKKDDESNMEKVSELKYILYNNMAECQLMRKNYQHTISLCCKVLNREANNAKALYRRGLAYGGLRNYEKAVGDLKTVVNLKPKDKKAQEKFNFYSEQWHTSVQDYKNIVRKMFKN